MASGGRVSALLKGDIGYNPGLRKAGWSIVKVWKSGEMKVGAIGDGGEGDPAESEYQLWQLKPLFDGWTDLVSSEKSNELDPRQQDAKLKRIPRHVPIELNFEKMLELGMPEKVVNLVRSGERKGEGVQTMDGGFITPAIAKQYEL